MRDHARIADEEFAVAAEEERRRRHDVMAHVCYRTFPRVSRSCDKAQDRIDSESLHLKLFFSISHSTILIMFVCAYTDS